MRAAFKLAVWGTRTCACRQRVALTRRPHAATSKGLRSRVAGTQACSGFTHMILVGSLLARPSAWRGLSLKVSLSVASDCFESRYFTGKKQTNRWLRSVRRRPIREPAGLLFARGEVGAADQPLLTGRGHPGRVSREASACLSCRVNGLGVAAACGAQRVGRTHGEGARVVRGHGVTVWAQHSPLGKQRERVSG